MSFAEKEYIYIFFKIIILSKNQLTVEVDVILLIHIEDFLLIDVIHSEHNLLFDDHIKHQQDKY
jgi:hypothetical protein